MNFLFEIGKILKKYNLTFTQELNEIIMGLYDNSNSIQEEVINELTQINNIFEL